jgi:hypothetical protein
MQISIPCIHVCVQHERTCLVRLTSQLDRECAAEEHGGRPTFWSTCSSGLLPMYSAPISWSAGISRGKLKGAMTATGPKGHLRPVLFWPMWSPGWVNPRARKRT